MRAVFAAVSAPCLLLLPAQWLLSPYAFSAALLGLFAPGVLAGFRPGAAAAQRRD